MGYLVRVEGLLVAETPSFQLIVQSTYNLRGRREEQRILPRIVIAFFWGGGGGGGGGSKGALARFNDCNQEMQRDLFVVGGNVGR